MGMMWIWRVCTFLSVPIGVVLGGLMLLSGLVDVGEPLAVRAALTAAGLANAVHVLAILRVRWVLRRRPAPRGPAVLGGAAVLAVLGWLGVIVVPVLVGRPSDAPVEDVLLVTAAALPALAHAATYLSPDWRAMLTDGRLTAVLQSDADRSTTSTDATHDTPWI